MTPQQELDKLRAELAALKAQQTSGIHCNVAPSGKINLRVPASRYPLATLSRVEWVQLMSAVPMVEKFLADNDETSVLAQAAMRSAELAAKKKAA